MTREPTPPERLAEQLAVVARDLADAGGVPDTLGRLVHLAVEIIAGCEHAGVSLAVGDRTEPFTRDDPVAATVARIRTGADGGALRDAVRDHDLLATGDLGHETRWGRFPAEVVDRTGVRSMLLVRLSGDGNTLGTLDLYATTVGAFDEHAQHAATILADHASIALYIAQQQQRAEDAAEHHDADVIGTAKGMLMVQQDLDEDAAADLLRETADRQDREAEEIAADIVERDPGA